jgi:hypothetical protein
LIKEAPDFVANEPNEILNIVKNLEEIR